MMKKIPPFRQFVVVVFVLVLLLSRVGLDDFLWGDDTALFKDASDAPFGSIFKPYAGYYYFLGRLSASLLFAILSPDWIPLAFNLIPVLVVAILAFVILNLRWLELKDRMILALATVILPHASEVYCHLCDVNWTLSLLPCIMLFQPQLDSISSKRSLFTVVVFMLLGLSSVYIALLSPLFGIRFLRLKSRSSGEVALLSVIVLTSAIQTAQVVSNGITMTSTNDVAPCFPAVFSPIVTAVNAILILPMASYVTSVGLLHDALHNVYLLVPVAFLVIVMCVAIAYLWASSEKAARTNSLVLFGLGYYLIVVCAARSVNALQLYLPMKGADRYFYLPYLFFTVALSRIVAIKCGTIARKITSYFVIVVLAVFYIFDWKISRAPEGSREIWQQQFLKLQTTGAWDYSEKNGSYQPSGNKVLEDGFSGACDKLK